MTSYAGEQADTLQVRNDADVVMARRRVRDRAREIDLDLVTQTKIVTAASELARNTVVHGGGGQVVIDVVHDERDADGFARAPRIGLRLVFTDHGPGIPDIERALSGGWSSGRGLGLGLSGSRRLVNDFDLQSTVDQGTQVTVVVWRRAP